MGIFDLFKKKPGSSKPDSVDGFEGPSYLEGYFSPILGLKVGQWQGKLVSPDGNTRFKIMYSGQRHEKHKNLIVGTSFVPAIIFAVDSASGQRILLFDGCRHGYNALFCDVYSQEQMDSRSVEQVYATSDGADIFEVTITTYNNIDYEDELSDRVDENGFVEVITGEKRTLDQIKRDGYGAITIAIKDMNGMEVDILSEELA